jgi:hypothetical protein
MYWIFSKKICPYTSPKSKFSHPINLPDIKLFTKYLGQTDGQEDNADLNDMDISGATVYQKIMDRF